MTSEGERIKITRLGVGQKPPAGSVVYLCRGTLDSRQIIEWFEQKESPDWSCVPMTNGFWYGYGESP